MTDKRRHLPSTPKAMAAIFAGITLAILASGYAYYRSEAERIRLVEYREIAAVAELKAGQIRQWRKALLEDVRRPAESPFFRRTVEEWRRSGWSGAERAQLRERLKMELSRGLRDALFLSPSGEILLAATDQPDPVSPMLRRTVAEVLAGGRALLTDFYRCPNGLVHIDAVAPVRSVAGDVTALLVLKSDASSYLFPLIQKWPVPSRSAESLLVRRDGDHVLFLNELRHRTGTELTLRLPLSRTDLPAARAVLGARGLFLGKDYRGVEVLADLRPVPESPWFLVAKVDTGEILAEARYRAVIVSLLALCLILLTAALLAYAYRRRQASLYLDLYRAERERREAHEEFRTTLYSIGDAVISTDGEGRVRRMNRVAEQLTGWSEADAVGVPLCQVFHIVNEETRLRVENPVERVLREGQVVGLANHTVLIARDGSERPIDDSAAPIRDENGGIIGVVLVFHDVTERKKAALALKENAEFLATLLDAIPAPVFYKDAEGRYLGVNRSFEEFYGLNRREIVGRSVFDMAPPELARVYHESDLELMEHPGTQVYETEVKDTGGRVHDVVFHKATFTDSAGNVRGIIGVILELTEERKMQEALRQSEERYRLLVEHSISGIAVHQVVLDGAGRPVDYVFLSANPAFETHTGLKRADVLGRRATEVLPGVARTPLIEIYGRVALSGEPVSFVQYFEPLGRLFYISAYRVGEGRFATIFTDITDQKRAEEEREKLQSRLNQAQKMEAIGRLAGGIAHDFNNLLNVVLGYADLSLMKIDPASPVFGYLEDVRKAGERAAALTRQLLAFARQQTIAPRVLDLNETVTGMLKMLSRLIGEEIDLVWKPAARIRPVLMDPAQIDQILANLLVNAKDAISGTGRITIETGAAEFDQAYCQTHPGFVPGEYVMLAVSDDGCGIEAENLPLLFEPFYTTKEVGKGTGLGLATVYGIVKQNNGFINVYSEPGIGTTFRIYLPVHLSGTDGAEHAPEPAEKPRGRETVLLVEDETALLDLTAAMLEELGYMVLSAGTPGMALQLAQEHRGDIHLLMTDVVMPEMNGLVLRGMIDSVRPGIRCLFMSGYTADAIAHHGVLEPGVHFLQKPFSMQDLAMKVREALAAAS